MSKPVRTIPSVKNGTGLMYTARSGQKYRVTSHTQKRFFYLWKVMEDGYILIAERQDPYDLYDIIDQLEGVTGEEDMPDEANPDQ